MLNQKEEHLVALIKPLDLVEVNVVRADNHAPLLEFVCGKPCDPQALAAAIMALAKVEDEPKAVSEKPAAKPAGK